MLHLYISELETLKKNTISIFLNAFKRKKSITAHSILMLHGLEQLDNQIQMIKNIYSQPFLQFAS